MPRLLVATFVVLGLLTSACASSSVGQRQAEALDDGVQATGRLDGRRIAISDGAPETNLDDCDPGLVADRDVCWIARTIDGVVIAFVVENPDAMVPGETLPVRDDDCTECDEITGHAVVDLRVDGTQRRAVSGRLQARQVGERYAAAFDVRLSDGDHLNGEFNIRRLLPEER